MIVLKAITTFFLAIIALALIVSSWKDVKKTSDLLVISGVALSQIVAIVFMWL